jgi:uncharacterized membrane protein YkoI
MKKILISGAVMAALFGTTAMAKDFTGSIKEGFFESDKTAMKKVKIDMIQAIQVAKKAVPGRVVKAKLEEEDGYLVYDLKIYTDKGQKVKVYVDPVTAKILYRDED